jgi:riboflavin kinase/FMN adenylyltransferase
MSFLSRNLAGPCLAPAGSVACVGAFDGVHLGHQALLAQARGRAAALGLQPLAVTFEPIPRDFFARGAPVPRLASVREKLQALCAGGMAQVLMPRFDAALAAMPAERFVRDVLCARAGVREVHVGADFRFGHGRAGDVDLLRRLGQRHGFGVAVMPEFAVAGERVSSSTIRRHLAAGAFDAAAALLGRRFTIGGHVVRGAGLGRTLGWPTANIRLGRRAAPVSGILAVRVHGAGASPLPGVASLGVRPTVTGDGEPLLEAHLFDFDGDLYGRRIEVEFVAKLRDEERFPDLAAMVRQIERDALAARAILEQADAQRPAHVGDNAALSGSRCIGAGVAAAGAGVHRANPQQH